MPPASSVEIPTAPVYPSLCMPLVVSLVLISLVLLPWAWADVDWAAWQRIQAAYKRGDYAATVQEVWPLAQQETSWAMVLLGAMYEAGQGVPQDYAQALAWYRKAAALELSKDAGQYRTEPLRGDGLKALPHICVTWDMLDSIDRAQIALSPLLVKGEERRRFQGKHGER